MHTVYQITPKHYTSTSFISSLRRGPGANVQDASGYSALHHAALNGHKYVLINVNSSLIRSIQYFIHAYIYANHL